MHDSKGPIANANNALQWAYINGFHSNINSTENALKLISLPQLGAYPLRYKKIFFRVKNKQFGKKQGLTGICSNFINLIAIKHVSRYFSVFKELSNILKKIDRQDNVLIISYDLQVPILKAIHKLKKRYSNSRSCLILPDLHGLTGGKKDLPHRIFEYIEKKQLTNIYQSIDSFVLISKYMIEKLPIKNKPFIVIEGIYNPSDKNIDTNPKIKMTKDIFYSGALDKRNGVHNLIKAFITITDPTYRLILCGDGYLRSMIEDAAKQDTRIEYKGQLEHSQVLALQQKATLLVNPRPSDREFTRYAFPSKTIEYFASSIPVLMYKLEGIPNEYYNYCYTPQDESIDELKKCIINICSQKEETLLLMGEKARRFILENKNSIVQTKILLEMTSKLF